MIRGLTLHHLSDVDLTSMEKLDLMASHLYSSSIFLFQPRNIGKEAETKRSCLVYALRMGHRNAHSIWFKFSLGLLTSEKGEIYCLLAKWPSEPLKLHQIVHNLTKVAHWVVSICKRKKGRKNSGRKVSISDKISM